MRTVVVTGASLAGLHSVQQVRKGPAPSSASSP